jgi:O-antigen/teichoic acid export membrane protein
MTSLKYQAASSVGWVTLNTFCTAVIQFIQLAILGRLLEPRTYGLMAIILVVIGFGEVLRDAGLSSAIIQRKNPKKDELSTLYWINIIFGLIIYIAIYWLAPLCASSFGTPEVSPLLKVAACSFVISAFSLQFQTRLRKALRFDVLMKINIISAFLGMITAVVLARLGYGVWSLVLGSLGNNLINSVSLARVGWREKWFPSFHFCWSDTRGYLSFGLYRIGAMCINFFNSRVDQMLIGVLLGPMALGYYNMAFRLVIKPVEKINPILTNVAFPVFSIIQDDNPRLKSGYLKMVRLIMSINAPLLIGFASVASLAVPLFVGDKWAPSVPVVQVLAFYTLIRSLGNAGGSLILAKGKANWSFFWNVSLTLIIPPIVYFASLGGNLVHVALALVGIQFTLFLFHYRFLIHNLIGPCFSQYLFALTNPIVLALAMGIIILLSSRFLATFHPNARLAIEILIGAMVYFSLSWQFQRNVIVDIIEYLPFRLRLSKLSK